MFGSHEDQLLPNPDALTTGQGDVHHGTVLNRLRTRVARDKEVGEEFWMPDTKCALDPAAPPV